MADLLKKTSSFIKTPKSSKKSSPLVSHSRSPSPPPLSPSPPKNIPAPLSDELLETQDKLFPRPPSFTAVESLTTPLPSTSPPPPALTQTAVIQREYASKVFEPSPLSQELPPPITQSEQEQIERQRGRYRFRKGNDFPRTLFSRSSSPIPEPKTDKTINTKNSGENSIPPAISDTTLMRIKEVEKRSGLANTFEEILGTDGSTGTAAVASPTILVDRHSIERNSPSQVQSQIESTSNPPDAVYRPDPFGLQAVLPTTHVMRLAENNPSASFRKRIMGTLKHEAKAIKSYAIHALTTGPRMNNDCEADMTHLERPGEAEEDMGTRRAKAVSRSWNKTDLITSYSLLVLVTTYYSLGSVNSVSIIKEAINDFAMRGEVKYYQLELAVSMLDVSTVLGIMIFAKLTNTYSRPLALFIAALSATGGLCIIAFSVTWETFSGGHALFHLGRSGALIVAQVIVSDTSDLSWRGVSIWGLDMGLALWVWTKPVVERFVIRKFGWHIPIWVFFSFSFPAAIPSLVSTYVFHRRAKRWGFFPVSKNVHQHFWWSPRGLWVKILLFSCEFDLLGIFLWTMGVGSLSTTLSVSEKMQTGVGIWMLGLLIGGTLCIMFLVLWELWLNNGLKATSKMRRQKVHQHNTRHSGASLPDERVMITGPAGYDSLSIEAVEAELSTIVAESHESGKLKGWGNCGAYRGKCGPLFRTRLLKKRAIPIGCLIGFLANFAMSIGFWSVWDCPENLPTKYKQLIERLQSEPMLMNIQFTSFMTGGLFVGLLIRMTKVFKLFLVSGLLLILCGLLTFHYTDICFIERFQIIVSQAIMGFGAGIVWISLLVCVQASCRKHSDVGISTALLMTSNAFGKMTAEAVRRFMQSYMMHLLPPETSQKYFLRALNRHWSVMLMVGIAAATFAFVMAGVGLAGHNLDEVKQCVSGTVFGTGDINHRGVHDENPSWATPSPFISSPEEDPSPLVPAHSPSGTNIEVVSTADGGTTALTLSEDRASEIGLPPVPEAPPQLQKSLEVMGHSTEMRGHESTAEWETAPSESAVSESHTTSDSRTITSPAHVPNSYIDDIFTMDQDMEQPAQTISPSIPDIFEDFEIETLNSPGVGTVICKGPSTTKQKTLRSKVAKGLHTVRNNMTNSGSEFSFKKRQIWKKNATPQTQGNSRLDGKSIWNNSVSDNGVESSGIDDIQNDFCQIEDIDNQSQNSFSPTAWEVLDQDDGEQQDFTLQLSPGDTKIQSECLNRKDPRRGQVLLSPQVALTMISDEVRVPQRSQNLIVDRRASHSGLCEPTLTPINISQQFRVAEMISKADTPTGNDSYSPEQHLSPIKELSSRGSMANPTPPVRPIGVLSTSGTPITIGLLTSHHNPMEGSKEVDRIKEDLVIVLTKTTRGGNEKGKEKANSRGNDHRE